MFQSERTSNKTSVFLNGLSLRSEGTATRYLDSDPSDRFDPSKHQQALRCLFRPASKLGSNSNKSTIQRWLLSLRRHVQQQDKTLHRASDRDGPLERQPVFRIPVCPAGDLPRNSNKTSGFPTGPLLRSVGRTTTQSYSIGCYRHARKLHGRGNPIPDQPVALVRWKTNKPSNSDDSFPPTKRAATRQTLSCASNSYGPLDCLPAIRILDCRAAHPRRNNKTNTRFPTGPSLRSDGRATGHLYSVSAFSFGLLEPQHDILLRIPLITLVGRSNNKSIVFVHTGSVSSRGSSTSPLGSWPAFCLVIIEQEYYFPSGSSERFGPFNW